MTELLISHDEYISTKLLQSAITAVNKDVEFETENNEMDLPDEVLDQILLEVSTRIGRFIRRRVYRHLKDQEWRTHYAQARRGQRR